jgi:hypothetical protein
MLCVLISVEELSCEPDRSWDIWELWVLRVEVDEMGSAAVGVGLGATLSGAMLSVEADVVAGSSKEILEKSWETDGAGATTGSGLNEEAGMTNSTRSRCWLSLIEMTIFSRSTGVMMNEP